MNKREVQQRVLKNGKLINLNLFNWNEEKRIFSSGESNLMIDFSLVDECVFETSDSCIFKTGDICAFRTGDNCVFYTGDDCAFDTGSGGVYKTGSNCFFDTMNGGVYQTGCQCSFRIGNNSIISTMSGSIIEPKFNCILVRESNFEVIKLVLNQTIRLNDPEGYVVLYEKEAEEYWHKFYK